MVQDMKHPMTEAEEKRYKTGIPRETMVEERIWNKRPNGLDINQKNFISGTRSLNEQDLHRRKLQKTWSISGSRQQASSPLDQRQPFKYLITVSFVMEVESVTGVQINWLTICDQIWNWTMSTISFPRLLIGRGIRIILTSFKYTCYMFMITDKTRVRSNRRGGS